MLLIRAGLYDQKTNILTALVCTIKFMQQGVKMGACDTGA